MLLSITFLMGCQERGMGKLKSIEYSFEIVDKNDVNIVGDNSNQKKYFVDSIKCFLINDNKIDTSSNVLQINGNVTTGFYFKSKVDANSEDTFELRYNNNETDSIRFVLYDKNIHIYINKTLIYNEYNPQRYPIKFKIKNKCIKN